MAKVLLLAFLLACSSDGSSGSSLARSPSADTAALPADAAMFVDSRVVAVVRGSAQTFPLIAWASGLWASGIMPTSTPPLCWTTLRAAIEVAYQWQIGGAERSYVVLEGALPRDEVERCAAALPDPLTARIGHAGELAVFDLGSHGTVYAAWRGRVVIAGREADVRSALAADDPALAGSWRERLAELPPAGIAAWSQDRLLESLFGIPTTSYLIAFDGARQNGVASIDGRLIAHYANEGDASAAAARLKEGSLIAAPAELVVAIQRMGVTRSGTTVEAVFDADTFAGLDFAILQTWLARAAAQAGAPRP